MLKNKWNINDWLTTGEHIIYESVLENENIEIECPKCNECFNVTYAEINNGAVKCSQCGEMLEFDEDIDECDSDKTHIFLTNYRIIWVIDDGEHIESRILKFISRYGTFLGYEDFSERDDIGTGEYGIYFGNTSSYDTFWFYSKDVWKAFYDELSRCLLED